MLERIRRLAWKDLPWLYCVGAALFLLAWLGEKELDRGFARQRDALERLQHQVASNRNLAQVWFSHMLLLGPHEPKNSQAVAFASLWYMEFALSALESAAAWGDENAAERKRLAEIAQSVLEPAKAAFRDGQYEKVASLASHVRSVELQGSGRLASANYRHIAEIEAQNDFWARLVRALYVVGAGLVGLAFVRSRLRPRAPSELTTIIDPPFGGRA